MINKKIEKLMIQIIKNMFKVFNVFVFIIGGWIHKICKCLFILIFIITSLAGLILLFLEII